MPEGWEPKEWVDSLNIDFGQGGFTFTVVSTSGKRHLVLTPEFAKIISLLLSEKVGIYESQYRKLEVKIDYAVPPAASETPPPDPEKHSGEQKKPKKK